jgi:hypothetical protein
MYLIISGGGGEEDAVGEGEGDGDGEGDGKDLSSPSFLSLPFDFLHQLSHRFLHVVQLGPHVINPADDAG